MKTILYTCDNCGKEQWDEMPHFDFAQKAMDLCFVCSTKAVEAMTAALNTVEYRPYKKKD